MSDPSPTARLDSFFVSEAELKFTEYNAETPAGAGYNDALSEIFFGLPVMRQFVRRYLVRPIPARPHVLHALLDSFEQFRGNRNEKPRIAILDHRTAGSCRSYSVDPRRRRAKNRVPLAADRSRPLHSRASRSLCAQAE